MRREELTKHERDFVSSDGLLVRRVGFGGVDEART